METPHPEVFAGVASFGSRAPLLEKTVGSLLGQVDRIGVYLNEYDEIPTFLDHPRILVARSQDHGNLRDNGKFFFLDEAARHRYYAAVDDDLLYPPDYISHLKAILADAGPGAAVGVHGAVYPTRVIGLSQPRHLYHFMDPLPYVMPVHLLGTGTVLFDQHAWRLRFEEFMDPGMADVWFARSARARDARLFSVNRDRNWLVDLQLEAPMAAQPPGPRLFAEAKADDSRQVQLLQDGNISDGGLTRLVRHLVSTDALAEQLSLSQSLALDDIRRAVGLPPLDAEIGNEILSGLEQARHKWLQYDFDTEAISHAAVAILTDNMPADIAERTLDTLQTIDHLRVTNMTEWKVLPYPLRFDTRETRLSVLNTAILRRSFLRSAHDARSLWSRLQQEFSPDLPPDLALAAERAGLETRFQRLPALRRNARKNPISAALDLREYLENHGWQRPPDILAWRKMFRDSFYSKEVQLLLCTSALRVGDWNLAAFCAESLIYKWPADFDAQMMRAIVDDASPTQGRQPFLAAMRVLDGVLDRVGLRTYTEMLNHPHADHWMDTFDRSGSKPFEDGPSVTVIMTIHNDVDTVAKALASVLASAGVMLELIVVDDASTDGSAQVIDRLEDERVRVIKNTTNLGPYASRNRALEIAKGEFVTIADADDWSHPDRLRFQAARLLAEPHLVACNTAHIRILPDGEPDLENNLLFMGHGPVSLMFRRSIVAQIGGFDHVRTRGDIEFMRRLSARFGNQLLASFEVPLILATSNPSSNSKRYSSDALRRYRQAMRQWHRDNAASDALYVPLKGERAAFMAPYELAVDA